MIVVAHGAGIAGGEPDAVRIVAEQVAGHQVIGHNGGIVLRYTSGLEELEDEMVQPVVWYRDHRLVLTGLPQRSTRW